VINLRYHIVSIVAVFLALGIGLALGSTFVDSVLVSNLEGQVDQLEADTLEAVAAREEAERLADQLVSERAEFEELTTPVLSSGRLDGRSVILIAPDTVDRAEVDRLRDLVVGSEASFGGVLWLTASFDLADGPTRTALADEFDLAGSSENAVRRAVTFLVMQALFDPGSAGETDTPAPRALTVLRDSGLVVYDPSFGGGELSAIGREDLLLLVVTDAGAQVVNDGFLFPLFEEIVDAGYSRSAVVVELEGAGTYGSVLERLRADPVLAAEFGSVDGVDTFIGILALVAALDQLPDTGHYGSLPTADGPLPR